MHIYNTTFDGVSLAQNVAKTVCLVQTPATRRARARGFKLSGISTTATDAPMLVELVRVATLGTPAGTAATPVPVDDANPAALCAGLTNLTAEPTTYTIVERWRLTPVGGTIVLPYLPEEMATSPVSRGLGIRVTAPVAQSGLTGTFTHEE